MLGQPEPPKQEPGLQIAEHAQVTPGVLFEQRMPDRLLVGLTELALPVVAGGGDRKQPGPAGAPLVQGVGERVVGLALTLALKQPPLIDDRGARVDPVPQPAVRGEQLVEPVSLRTAQLATWLHPGGQLALLDPLAGKAMRDPRLILRAGDPVHLRGVRPAD
jgi:hypothetical protein